MDRKYRQAGYQDESKDEPERRKTPRDREGPRSPAMTSFQGVMRCGMCGGRLEVELDGVALDSQCPHCRADLRTCRNCVSFDPGARFQCRAEVQVRVANKTTRNECELFNPRKTVEKKTSETRKPNLDDPRAAFDRLFKK